MSNERVQCRLSDGSQVEMSVDEAAIRDTPEGSVTILVSATMYRRLIGLLVSKAGKKAKGA